MLEGGWRIIRGLKGESGPLLVTNYAHSTIINVDATNHKSQDYFVIFRLSPKALDIQPA